MAAILDVLIPQQNFELIRNKVGLIIAEECANQFILGATQLEHLQVFVDRFVPIQVEECPVVNVSLDSVSFTAQDAITQTGEDKYFVDVYTRGKTTTTKRGDEISSFDCARILGIIRAILENPRYNTLGFAKPSIERVTVESIQMAQPNDTKDASNIKMGRLSLLVKRRETVQLVEGDPSGGVNTSIKLAETDFGFKYIDTN